MKRFHTFTLNRKGSPVLLALLLIASLTSCLFPGSPPAREPQRAAAIARVWHGRTSAARADEYEVYLNDAGIRKIRSIPGNIGVQMFRRSEGETEEFIVISYWESRDVIRGFAGADIEKTHHLPRDPEFLVELEPLVRHYDVVVNEWTER